MFDRSGPIIPRAASKEVTYVTPRNPTSIMVNAAGILSRNSTANMTRIPRIPTIGPSRDSVVYLLPECADKSMTRVRDSTAKPRATQKMKG